MKHARFIAAARIELLAEIIYYNDQQPGLGERFTAAIEEATGLAVAFPLAGSPARFNTRRVIVKWFPYGWPVGRGFKVTAARCSATPLLQYPPAHRPVANG